MSIQHEWRKMLCMSTAHLDEKTTREWSQQGEQYLTCTNAVFPEGFFTYVADDTEGWPASLVACLDYARNLGADYIQFDRDALVYPDLQQYEW